MFRVVGREREGEKVGQPLELLSSRVGAGWGWRAGRRESKAASNNTVESGEGRKGGGEREGEKVGQPLELLSSQMGAGRGMENRKKEGNAATVLIGVTITLKT